MNEDIHNESVEKILLSASSLFSAAGYHGTSIRDIAKHAGANLAAVNYHFGDKESLYCVIITRGLQTINLERLTRLNHAIQNAGDRPVPLTTIIDIFARPIFKILESRENAKFHLVRLIGRSLVEPLPFVDELLKSELHPVTTRFAQAIRRHVPSLSPTEFMWRISFVVGAMHHTLATMHRMNDLTRGLCSNNDSAAALRHFTQFAAASLVAPGWPPEK